MRLTHWMTVAGGATALLGLVTLSGPAAWAQEATPQAAEAVVPRPAHIHNGNCDDLGDIVAPLTDLTEPTTGDRLGQARRAIPAETSYTVVPMTLDAILGSDHAVNVHLSADQIGTYIACGDIGGRLTPNGALAIGLHEMSNSGYTGIAYLNPDPNGTSTDVSVFIAQTQQGGRNRNRAAEGTPAGVGGATTVETPAAGATLPVASPEGVVGVGAVETPAATGEISGTPAAAGGMAGMPGMTGTPAAAAGAGAMMAGQQVPVSLSEFMISLPTTLPAGDVTFAVTNDGTVTHGFEIEGNGIEQSLDSTLEPGDTGMLNVNLTPGTYTVYCPVDGHRQLGMEAQVTVA